MPFRYGTLERPNCVPTLARGNEFLIKGLNSFQPGTPVQIEALLPTLLNVERRMKWAHPPADFSVGQSNSGDYIRNEFLGRLLPG